MTDCMVRGCSASSGSSLHYIPKDPQVRQKWVDFIYKNRVSPECVDRIRICSVHFTEECFTNYRQKLMGFSKRLILRPTAVPTVYLQTDPGPALRHQQDTEGRESDTGTVWLCPLCQQGKRNRHTLALHLTKKHSVFPVCLKKLLDAADPIPTSTDDEGQSSAQNTNGAPKRKVLGKNTKPSLASPCKDLRSSALCGRKGSKKDKEVHEQMGGLNNEGTVVGVLSVNDARSSEKSSAEDDVNSPFRCDTCLESFPTQLALNAHSSASHVQKLRTKARTEDSMSDLLRRYVAYRPYQCDVCNVAYNHAISLESHLKSVLHQTRARSAAKAAKAKSNSGSRKMAAMAKLTSTAASTVQSPTPLTPAQALSAYLPVLTFTPSSIVPSVFTTPNSRTPHVLPQPQMVLINGLQTKGNHNQASQESISATSSSQRVPSLTSPSSEESDPLVEGVAIKVEVEIKEEPCMQAISQITEDEMSVKRENSGVKCKEELDDASRINTRDPAVQDSQVSWQSSDLRDTTYSKTTIRIHPKPSLGTPVLNEFQSQVLLAFLESRLETNSGSPSIDECEALSKEVGLTKDVVHRWLVNAWHSREVVGPESDNGQILRSSTVFLSEEEGRDEDQTTKERKRKRIKCRGKPVCKKRGRKRIIADVR